MVQQSVLDTIDDPSLRVYVVWEPILGSDTAESAQKAPSLIPDRRATHFWTGSRDVAAMFQAPIGLQPHPAWDVYLVYAPGTRWDAAVPAPEYFQHQLGGRLPKEQLLNGAVLAERVRALLEPAPAR